jgi:hypothetical protein
MIEEPMRSFRLHFRLIAALLGLSAAAALLDARAAPPLDARPSAPGDEASLDDPFPIQRVFLAKDQLAAELERAKSGALVKLSRAEFEKRVRLAAAGARAPVAVPKLVAAHYRARLLNDGLGENSMTGTADWQIVHNGPGPALLPLDALQLALGQARWSDKRMAVLGFLEPGAQPGLTLLVGQAGEQRLALDWSARGVPEQGELRFDLAVPLSPIATLELELPRDLKPFFPQDEAVLLSSPGTGAGGAPSSWRVAFGGLTHLEVLLRPANASGQAAAVEAAISTRQDLSPGLLQSQATFEFKSLGGDLTELQVEHDPELSIVDVSILNLDSWQPLPGKFGNKKRARVRLSEPARGGQLRISATSALPVNENLAWTSPSMAIVGATPRGETLRLRVGPDLVLTEWRSGAFRLLRNEFAADRSQALTLGPALAPEGAPPVARPSARLRLSGVAYRVQQQTEWDVGADRALLTARLNLEVVRGTLSQLALRIPGGWDVDRVEAGNQEMSPIWSPPAGAPPSLHLELQRPLHAGAAAELVVRLSRAGPNFNRSDQLALPFPDIVPDAAISRDGEYVVRVSPAFRATAPEPPRGPEVVGPQAPETLGAGATWAYRYHGQQAPAGRLVLRPRAPRLSVVCDSAVSLAAGHPVVATRLTLQPEAGALSSLIVSTSEPVALPWSWRTVTGSNQVMSMRPLPLGPWFALLGARGPLQAVGLVQDQARLRWWRMSFARPLDAPLTLETILEPASPRLPVDDQRRRLLTVLSARSPLAVLTAWAAALNPPPPPDYPYVPLLQVAGASSQTGVVVVQMPPEADLVVETKGLVRDLARQAGTTRRETYRYDGGALSLRGRGLSDKKVEDAVMRVDGAELISVVELNGSCRCLFRFRVKYGPEAGLPIRLPAEAQVLAVGVAGQALAAESCQSAGAEEQSICIVPLPANSTWQRIEILYALPARGWTLSTHLKPELPALPVASPGTRFVWRLPPGVLPSSAAGLARLPGGPGGERLFRAPSLTELENESFDARRRPGNVEPPVAKSGAATKSAPAVRTVQQLLSSPGSLAQKPLIDALALVEADVQPATPAPAGLEALGLVLAPIPGGQILTTPRQQSLWRSEGPGNGALAAGIGEAMEQAIRWGRDATGRFRTLDDWLESANRAPSALLAELGGDGPGWTAWEAQAPRAELTVVRTGHVAIVGWLSAAILAVAGILLIGRLGRAGVLLLLLWLLAAGGALLGLPAALSGLALGPFLAGLLVAFLSVCLRRSPPRKERPTMIARLSNRSRLPAAGSATATMILLCALASPAAAPGPVVVYLLAAADGEPAMVLVAPELLERLDLLARPRLALAEAVILRAHYDGRCPAASAAEFHAELDVVAFADQASLALPLGDVRLREVLLDGAAAFPKNAGNDRIVIDIKDKGEHKVEIKFSAPIAGLGPDREVRISTPEVAICELEFYAPATAEQVRASNWRGAQSYDEEAKFLRADLGRARSAQVRWRQAGVVAAAQVRVLEASLWDIDAAAATLRAAFDYHISQGMVTALKVALPPNLDLARVEVHPDSTPLGAPPTWVREWSVGPDRVLTVELQAALTGTARLWLEGVPTRSLTNRPALQAPAALGAADSDAVIAYRLRGLEAPAEFERRNVVDMTVESFLKDWRVIGPEKAPASIARAFRRGKGDAQQILLRPVLHATPAATRASQDITWSIGPRGVNAEARATANWSAAAAAPLTFVEWEVPGAITLHDVRGLNLHSWLRSGTRVIAWLREPAAETTLVWYGSLARGAQTGESAFFDAPAIKQDGAATVSTIVRVRAPDGWVVAAENAAGLGTPVPPVAEREVSVLLARPVAPSRFQLRGPQAGGEFRVLTVAEVVNRRLELTTSIEPQLRRDRPHSFSVVVRNGAGWEMDWQAPAASWQTPPARRAPVPGAGPDRREWIVNWPAHEGAAPPLRLVMRRALDSRSELTLPDIAIQAGEPAANVDAPLGPGPVVHQRLVLLGPELRELEMAGLRPGSAALKAVLAAQPTLEQRWRERGGSLWRGDGDEVRARISASPSPLGAAPGVRIGLADLEATALAERWVYRATYDLRHESGATLQCTLPAGATLEGLALEGVALPTPGAGAFTAPLPPEGGPRLLQLVWSAGAPSWETPRLQDASGPLQPAVLLWTIAARPGERFSAPEPISAALIDLRRADALLKLAADGSAASAGDVNAARLAGRAARWARLADMNLAGPRSEAWAQERGPGGATLADWSARLREQAAALRPPRPREQPLPAVPVSLRDATFEQLPYADAFHSGVPLHWAGSAADVQVRRDPGWTPLPALASFALLALTLAVLGAFMLLPRPLARPEQVALIGVLGAVAFGPPEGYLFAPVIVIALLLRVGWLAGRFVRWAAG